MYILIDRQQMAIVHKHRDRKVLSDLSWIECTNAAITIPLGNPRHFSDFTPQELRLLYQHATGHDLKGYGNVLHQVVHNAAMRMPESVVNADEVAVQRLCVMDGDKSSYQYCPGSKTPTCHPGLFEPDSLKCARSEADESLAASSTPAFTTPAAPGASNPFSTAAWVPRPPSAPRTGGSRETIFRVADEMWTARGSPRELPTVLALRKDIMVELEANHGIKKTTSSTALGDWQKQRLS